MQIRTFVVTSALVTTFVVAGSPNTFAGARQTTVKTDDSSIDSRIDARIGADATLKKMDIDTSVDQGVVTLTGKVRTSAEKAKAERLVKVTGVSRVDNRLEIDANAGNSNIVEKAADKTVAGAKAVGRGTQKAVSTTGEVITDSWITTRVNGRFVNEDSLKGSDINVDTNDHIVTLKGTVMSEAGRERAAVVAKGTEGVDRVVNQLVIGPKR